MDYGAYCTLKIDRDSERRIITVFLHRPDRLNAVDETMHRELSQVFEDIGRDDGVDVVVLAGSGRCFCAGGDLEWIRSMPAGRAMDWLSVEGKKIVRGILDLPQPVIAGVHGVASGLGATIALFADMIVMGEGCRISDPHVRVGLVAGDGGAVIWPLLVGVARAKEYLLTGESMGAQEALRSGLVNRVVPDGEVLGEAMKLAERLVKGSQPAIRLTKRSVNRYVNLVAEAVLDYSLKMEQSTFGSNDVREGTAAILEKRAPSFGD